VFVRAFSPDGRYLLFYEPARGLAIWEIERGRKIALPGDQLQSPIFAPSGEIIGSLVEGGFLAWNPGTGLSTRRAIGRSLRTSAATISHNGKVLATADSSAKRIQIWSAKSFQFRNQLPENSYRDGTLALTPDGKTLAARGPARTLRLWDVATGQEILTFEEVSEVEVGLQFSPDGRALAAMSYGNPWLAAAFHVWHAAPNDLEPADQRSENVTGASR
jgi:WD40 repeat protein